MEEKRALPALLGMNLRCKKWGPIVVQRIPPPPADRCGSNVERQKIKVGRMQKWLHLLLLGCTLTLQNWLILFDIEFTIGTDDSGQFVVTYKDATTKATEEARRALNVCQSSKANGSASLSVSEQFRLLEECLLEQAEKKVNASKAEVAFQRAVGLNMSASLLKYTCDDNPDFRGVNVTTSPSLKNETYWETKQIQTLFESPESAIKLYKGFLDDSECQMILDAHISKVEATGDAMSSIIQKMNALQTGDPRQEGTNVYTTSKDVLSKVALASTTEMMLSQDDDIQARLQVMCPTFGAKGGVIYFPRAGIRIVPEPGDAIVSLYQTMPTEENNFLRDQSMCAVRQGSIAKLEHIYRWN